MVITILVLLSLVGIIISFFAREPMSVFTLSWSVVLGVMGIATGIYAMFVSPIITTMWYINPSTGFFLMLVSLVQMSAMIAGMPYLRSEIKSGVLNIKSVRIYFALFALFVSTMILTVCARNAGMAWVMIEATTLATTFLVAFYARRGSLEAAWKYLILCSTGIALAFVSIILLLYGLQTAESISLDWDALRNMANGMDITIAKLAFIFALVGFGTKVGLAPMHNWLPDAHSQAPSPISAMLSGVLLPVAMLVVLRFKEVVDVAIGNEVWTGNIMIFFGVLSIVVAGCFILVQQDYKRLMAYSSIEHMGLAFVMFGIGGAGAIAGVIHVVGHALAKSGLFFAAGNMVNRYHSTKFATVYDVSRNLPLTGPLFWTLTMVLLAVPPSPLFASEIMLFASGTESHIVVVLIIAIMLAIVLNGFLRAIVPMLFSADTGKLETDSAVMCGEQWNASHTVLVAHIGLLVLLGIYSWSAHGMALAERIANTL